MSAHLPPQPLLEQLQKLNEAARFNRWLGLEVDNAEIGSVVLSINWRAELGQYSNFMHAGIIGALIDTACGFAAVTVAGTNLLASHYSVNCLRPAVGRQFIVRAKVVKPGKTQIFTAAELHAVQDGTKKLVSTGEAILTVVT